MPSSNFRCLSSFCILQVFNASHKHAEANMQAVKKSMTGSRTLTLRSPIARFALALLSSAIGGAGGGAQDEQPACRLSLGAPLSASWVCKLGPDDHG